MKKLIILFLLSAVMKSNAMVTSPIIGRKIEQTQSTFHVNAYAPRPILPEKKQNSTQEKSIQFERSNAAFLENRFSYWIDYLNLIYTGFNYCNIAFIKNLAAKYAYRDLMCEKKRSSDKNQNKKG